MEDIMFEQAYEAVKQRDRALVKASELCVELVMEYADLMVRYEKLRTLYSVQQQEHEHETPRHRTEFRTVAPVAGEREVRSSTHSLPPVIYHEASEGLHGPHP